MNRLGFGRGGACGQHTDLWRNCLHINLLELKDVCVPVEELFCLTGDFFPYVRMMHLAALWLV